MISIIIGILAGIAIIASVVAAIAYFLPHIIEWFNNSINILMGITGLFPAWLLPYILVVIMVAIISLGVKLL